MTANDSTTARASTSARSANSESIVRFENQIFFDLRELSEINCARRFSDAETHRRQTNLRINISTQHFHFAVWIEFRSPRVGVR